MGCCLSLRQYREALTQQSLYGIPPGTKLGPLCEFLRRVFPTEQPTNSADEGKEEELYVPRRRKTVLEQLNEEEEKYRAGMAMFNEFERDPSTDYEQKEEEADEEEEDCWWDEVTSSDDRYSRD